MRKYGLLLILLSFWALTAMAFATDDLFDETEIEWLNEHQDTTLSLGLDPFSGMDYFMFQGKQQGYILDVVKQLEKSTGLSIEIIGDWTWGEVYQGLQSGKIDILFGANATPERLEFMSFTEPIMSNPYAVFTSKSGRIKNMGDLEGKKIGFIEGDIAIDMFKSHYNQLSFEIIEYADQPAGLNGLVEGEISAFITSGGNVVYDFLYRYPELKLMTDIEEITSDMTLSTRKSDEILAGILSKVIQAYKTTTIETAIGEAKVIYNRKILQLTPEELSWLEHDGHVNVGIVNDYLPFDFYSLGEYKGIAGEIITEMSEIVGMNLSFVHGDFDDVYQKALDGEVDVLNIAKTNERLAYFSYPRAFSEERDQIYGLRNSDYISDIYGLEGKRVAVIKGFWHKELLEKNLSHVTIVPSESIMDSLKMLNNGKVDYLIENPTVADYYISGLGYWGIMKKGETSTDSFLYFGVRKDEKALAGIIDKTLSILDYDRLKQRGLKSVPTLTSRNVYYLIGVIIALVVVISIIIFILYRAIKTLILERESIAALKAKEHLMYSDPLTELNNRLYFNSLEETFDQGHFPQVILISDLNNLKLINDTQGHHMGDAYIKAYGDLLKRLAQDEIVCRMGGDEFLIYFEQWNVQRIEGFIEELREAMNSCRIEGEGQMVISAAIGYAIRYDRSQTMEDVIREADNNMYQDKARMKELR